MKPSLSDYVAAAKKAQWLCVVCALPADLLKQVNGSPSLSKPLVTRWLKDQGHIISIHQLRQHQSRCG